MYPDDKLAVIKGSYWLRLVLWGLAQKQCIALKEWEKKKGERLIMERGRMLSVIRSRLMRHRVNLSQFLSTSFSCYCIKIVFTTLVHLIPPVRQLPKTAVASNKLHATSIFLETSRVHMNQGYSRRGVLPTAGKREEWKERRKVWFALIGERLGQSFLLLIQWYLPRSSRA